MRLGWLWSRIGETLKMVFWLLIFPAALYYAAVWLLIVTCGPKDCP
jgi:uncharacterized membrane protein YeiB